MDTQQFLAVFGHIANAPGGVARLRELVIQLAISGKLADRDVKEASVANAIDEAQTQRIAYEVELDLRSTRLHPALSSLPFSVPEHWQWVRLEQICLYIQRGKGPKYSDKSSIRVVSQKCIQWSGFDLAAARFIDEDSLASYRTERFLCSGDLLWNSTGTGTAGRVAVYQANEEVKAVADSHVTVIRVANCSPRYLWCVIASPWVQSRIEPSHPESLVSGTTQQVELNTSTVRALPVPVPPIEEQFRIVAKVDELMALCDKLEVQQQVRRKLQNNLRQSTLQAVASATSPHDLQTTWARLADNFGRLFHAPEDVDEFVAELKNMAVRGLLSLPSASPTDAEQVVADCDSLRDQYIASGLMRRQKLVTMAETEVIYPEHWTIAPFDKVAIVIGGVTKGRDMRGRDVVTCPYLAVANVQRGFFKLTELKTIQIGTEELNKYLVKEGDLLITEGGDWDKVGRTAIWRGGVENCLHQNHVFKARVPSSSLLNEWVELVFNSGVGRDYFAGASKQTTNLASINMTQLRSFPMPIPPLDEQRLILVKVDALTDQAGRWRKQLQRKQHLASLLAGATVAAFTGIAAEQKEEPMKAPQTELISLLRLGKEPDVKALAPLATILARHNGEMLANDLLQRFGSEIDAFYAQLKAEVAHGWILEPSVAVMREKLSDKASS
ncbi:restriction endonuclease subunit S [Pseudomonas viridiflava]|uniref:restriction endonuclease subunit S n=1 Tax=Pseudomonas viridiflava TaxID=33069 RepID=UPI002EAF2FE0|nr:restriction endonuclease subunit S [Pseudomonas viridiflava]